MLDASAVGQTATHQSRSREAATASDEVYMTDGCLAHNLRYNHEDDDKNIEIVEAATVSGEVFMKNACLAHNLDNDDEDDDDYVSPPSSP